MEFIWKSSYYILHQTLPFNIIGILTVMTFIRPCNLVDLSMNLEALLIMESLQQLSIIMKK